MGLREVLREALLNEIKAGYIQSEKRYGSPRITQTLNEQGQRVSRPLVARIMRNGNIRSIIRKKYRVQTTDSNHPFVISENLLNQDFTAERLGEKWVSDIAYSDTYLTTIPK